MEFACALEKKEIEKVYCCFLSDTDTSIMIVNLLSLYLHGFDEYSSLNNVNKSIQQHVIKDVYY